MAGNYDLVSSEMKEIRNTDLNAVDIVDFIIVNIDTEVHACGTYEEIFWANRMKKPVLVHCEQGKKGLPDWLFGMMPHELMFGDWMPLKEYLINVDFGMDTRTFNRWTLFDLGKKTLASMLRSAENDPALREMVEEWSKRQEKKSFRTL
jgi:hypothetical protein